MGAFKETYTSVFDLCWRTGGTYRGTVKRVRNDMRRRGNSLREIHRAAGGEGEPGCIVRRTRRCEGVVHEGELGDYVAVRVRRNRLPYIQQRSKRDTRVERTASWYDRPL